MAAFHTIPFRISVAFSPSTHIQRLPLLRRAGQYTRGLTTDRPRRRQTDVPKAVLRPRIAVVGGGFAGLSTALKLSSLPWSRLSRPEITLIDKSGQFVFLPMMYELALSQVAEWEVAPQFSSLLDGTGIKFVQGTVENLDLSRSFVTGSLKSGREFDVPFDRAVLAIGAEPAIFSKVPGAPEHAIPFYGLSGALRLKKQLASLRKQKAKGDIINVVVVGGGFSGVELASCLAEELSTLGSVLLVESNDRIYGSGTDFNRECSLKALSENGVAILYNSRVTEVSADQVVVSAKEEKDGEKESTYPADLTLWTAGNQPNSALQNFGIELDQSGRARTDQWLRVKGEESRLFAVGDLSIPDDENRYLGTAQVAVQQAEYAAWNVWASLTDRKLLRYRYVQLGEMLVLGKSNGAVSTCVGVNLDGVAAWVARRVAYIARMPTESHRKKVAASWALNPLLRQAGDLVAAGQRYQTNSL